MSPPHLRRILLVLLPSCGATMWPSSVGNLSISSSGSAAGIGTTLTLTVRLQSAEPGITVQAATINGVDVSASWLHVGPAYQLTYTVVEGHPAVARQPPPTVLQLVDPAWPLGALDQLNQSLADLYLGSFAAFVIDTQRPVLTVSLRNDSTLKSGAG